MNSATDGGSVSDGGASDLDAGSDEEDAGLDSSDASIVIADAATDAGDRGEDAGPSLIDAGLVVTDAGVLYDDAGPSAVDAGLAEDAGFDTSQNADAGDADAGPVESVSIDVEANPTCVLTALATVSWTGPIASIQVGARPPSGTTTQTPPLDVSQLTSPQTMLVLGLSAQTTYAIQAIGTDSPGNTLVSGKWMLTTSALPDAVPSFDLSYRSTGTPGYTLMSMIGFGAKPGGDYMTIVDPTGTPVWYVNVSPKADAEFQHQPDGTITVAVDDPAAAIPGLLDSAAVFQQFDMGGNLLQTWTALDVPATLPDGPVSILATNEHDIELQPNGDMLLFGMDQLNNQDLQGIGGQADASIVGDVLERVTPDGNVTFAWDSLQHLSPTNIDPVSTDVTIAVVDFTHANDVDVMADGNYLVSFRNLSQVIKLDANTGEIIWKLGGADGQFTFVNDPLSGFSCQHSARELANGDILLFDDGDGHSPQQSRAVEYALDTTAQTATLVWVSEDSPARYTNIMGSVQRLANGNTLIAYGGWRIVEEVDPGGSPVWDLQGPLSDQAVFSAMHIDSLYPP
jgi:hypothetical protein